MMADAAPSFGTRFSFTLITNDPVIAARADHAGVDHIGLDFETFGKRERQPDLAEWVSDHRLDEIAPVREAVCDAHLFARTDPWHEGSATQIEALLARGVDSLMLPMFTRTDEVARFVDRVAGRAYVSLLLETPQALVRIDDILRVPGIDEVSLGLNDLYRAFGLKSHFEILTSDLLVMVSEKIRARGIRFGFGTLGKVRDTHLPVPPDLVYAQYPRLGATSGRLFRFFLGPDPQALDLDLEVRLLRARLTDWDERGREAQEEARRSLIRLFEDWRK
jgi:hypothetical protein